MPNTWGDHLAELNRLQQQGVPNGYDVIRRNAIAELAKYTKRDVILYASGHLDKPFLPPFFLSIGPEDMEGFMEALHGLRGKALDLVLHSPGGRAEATEAILNYLRSKYDNIRVIVPHEAMSAATMLACGADEIVMGRQSYLGPIDPQMQFPTQSVAAQAILDQFERAKREISEDQTNLAVWVPSLQQDGPALLEQCHNALRLSRELVSGWLATWMLKGDPKATEKAEAIAAALSDHKTLLTHGRPLGRDKLRKLGMKIESLEKDQKLQDRVLSVYHAAMHTFGGTPAAKIIENHQGRCIIRMAGIQPIPPPAPAPIPDPQ